MFVRMTHLEVEGLSKQYLVNINKLSKGQSIDPRFRL